MSDRSVLTLSSLNSLKSRQIISLVEKNTASAMIKRSAAGTRFDGIYERRASPSPNAQYRFTVKGLRGCCWSAIFGGELAGCICSVNHDASRT
jgi:hypothetical protein